MMYGHGYGHGSGMGAWGWFAMVSGTVLIWALLVLLAVVLHRVWTADRHSAPESSRAPTDERAAERILAERFARGEIDETEYRSRLAVLRGGPS